MIGCMLTKRKRESGQGMVEYGLVTSLISVWVIAVFMALKPVVSEKFAVESINKYAGEGQAHIASELGVQWVSTSGGSEEGGDEGDDF